MMNTKKVLDRCLGKNREEKLFYFEDTGNITEGQIKKTTFKGDKLLEDVQKINVGESTMWEHPKGSRQPYSMVKRIK